MGIRPVETICQSGEPSTSPGMTTVPVMLPVMSGPYSVTCRPTVLATPLWQVEQVRLKMG